MLKRYTNYFEGCSAHPGDPNEEIHPFAPKTSRTFGANFVNIIENKKTKNSLINFWFLEEITNKTLEIDYQVLSPTACLLGNVSMKLTSEVIPRIISSAFFQYHTNDHYEDKVDTFSFKNIEDENIIVLPYPKGEQYDSLTELRYSDLIDNVSEFRYDSSIENLNELMYDGLYITSCDFKAKNATGSQNYLRFYPDGNVIAVGTNCDGDIKKIAGWFNLNKEHIGRGTYKTNGEQIEFSTSTTSGSLNFNGKINKNGKLILEVNNLINGYKADREYFFVQINDIQPNEISSKNENNIELNKGNKKKGFWNKLFKR